MFEKEIWLLISFFNYDIFSGAAKLICAKSSLICDAPKLMRVKLYPTHGLPKLIRAKISTNNVAIFAIKGPS